MHDEPPEPFEHDGQDVPRPALFQGRRRLEAQQHYGFHNDHELSAHAWGYFPDLEFTYSKEGEPLILGRW